MSGRNIIVGAKGLRPKIEILLNSFLYYLRNVFILSEFWLAIFDILRLKKSITWNCPTTRQTDYGFPFPGETEIQY